MIASFVRFRALVALGVLSLLAFASEVRAEQPAPPNEAELGNLVITGHSAEKLPRIAVLPSLSPDLEDVIVRSVVRHDIELTGLFDVISDSKAPIGLYGFDDSI